ncbi:preprotein translocase subunit SecY [Paenibacillus amylolyticus]|uniref:Preprotein translocase subunit SecY n=1 Tax=Paenibacillus amylolyticus TaxID=1451 RepID=A0AAP5GZQ6_PAEAM|nr:preprotein translocase subunit SecY [Paenibacillus amylolyticus]
MYNKKSTITWIWIIALIIELVLMSGLNHRVHSMEEVVFHITLIVVTLVVGSVLVLSLGNKS